MSTDKGQLELFSGAVSTLALLSLRSLRIQGIEQL